MTTGHSVHFQRNRRLAGSRRAPFLSQPNLNYNSTWQLNHLNPGHKKAPHRKSHNSVSITINNAKLHANRHIASAHKLIAGLNDDEPNFKSRLRSLLNTYNFQITMVVLIILDCVMVLGEMIIELKLFQNEECEKNHMMKAISSTMAPVVTTTTTLASTVAEIVGEGLSQHASGNSHPATARAAHNNCEHMEHLLHNVEHIFHLTSIFILFLFNVELIVRLYAHGYKYFLNLEIALDALIVIVSFSLDVAFLNNGLKRYLYLLIILRLWRVLRVVHAIITAIRAPFERQVEKLKKKKKMLQRDLAKAYFYSNMLEEEIKNLRRIIDEFEYVDDEPEEEHYDTDDEKKSEQN